MKDCSSQKSDKKNLRRDSLVLDNLAFRNAIFFIKYKKLLWDFWFNFNRSYRTIIMKKHFTLV